MGTKASASSPGGDLRPGRGIQYFALRMLPLLAVAVLFARTLRFGFVLDDNLVILQRSRFLDGPFAPLAALRMEGYEDIDLPFYRPLYLELLWTMNRVAAGKPWPFHAANVALHGLNAMLLALVLRRLGARELSSAAAALVFAVHPGVVLDVAHAAACADPLAMTCLLGAFAAWLSLRERFRIGPLAAFAGASLLGPFAKEIALALPLLIGAHALIFRNRAGGGPMPRASRRAWVVGGAVLATGVVIYVLARRHAMHDKQALAFDFAPLPIMVRTWGYYIRCLVWPFGIVVRPNRSLFQDDPSLLAIGVASIIVLPAIFVRVRDPIVRLGLVWVAVFIAPVTQTLGITYPGSHHYLYAPCAGMAMVAGQCCAHLAERARTRSGRSLLLGSVAVALSAVAVETYRASSAFSSEEALWRANLERDPQNEVALTTLSDFEARRGRREIALWLAERAVRAQPLSDGAAYARALALERLGRHGDALQAYDRLLSSCERNLCTDALMNGGIQAFQLGDRPGALGRLVAARNREPSRGRPWALLVAFFNDVGDTASALRAYEDARRVAPPCSDLEMYHGVTLQLLGRFDEALSAFDGALELDARSFKALKARGLLNWNARHDRDRALSDLRRYLDLSPLDPSRPTIEALVAELEGKSEQPVGSTLEPARTP